MIDKGFTYCIPPYMIRSDVVSGVMSFEEMEGMMYKIEGEDLYLIGTSEHSMIGRFMGQTLAEDKLPQTLTSYSPCFRKEKGAHGLEERGIYRIHQFEKQEALELHRRAVCFNGNSRAPAYLLFWRFGRYEVQELRRGSVESPPEEIFRSGKLFQPHGRAGAQTRHKIQKFKDGQKRVRPYA